MKTIFNLQLLVLLLLFGLISCHKDTTKVGFSETIRFEDSDGLETSTYDEVIAFYEDIAEHSSEISIDAMGKTDSGNPLHLVSISKNKNPSNLNLLINNGIHPGESDGIDASMLLLKDIVNGHIKLPDNINLYIIPSYNIGGMLNRNSTSRANQNGPKAYGFRGNARNFDLNRDFIKMDTKNMEAFASIFHKIKPDVYVETHVSNGADYQYTLTHLLTQHNRLCYHLGDYLESDFKVKLKDSLARKGHMITPYVNVYGRTPEGGFSQFMDYPRYSTGYTSLWNTLGLMIETHMLKPYKNRVLATKDMLETLMAISSIDAEKIQLAKANTTDQFLADNYYKFNFKIDSTRHERLDFKGYEAEIMTSEVTGKPRLKFNRDKPYTKSINYYNQFKALDSVKIPDYYVIKKGWDRILTHLALNEIAYEIVINDTVMAVEGYRISDYNTYTSPYEGHYPHYNTKVFSTPLQLEVKTGDVIVPVRQSGIKYILETLEPEMNDSFFNWNFFDTILQQKEGFSGYVFEDYAFEFLDENPDVKAEFEALKTNDEEFGNNAYAQLNWIFKRSPLYEEAHLNYPVYRVFD